MIAADAYTVTSGSIVLAVVGGAGITVCLGYALQVVRPSVAWRVVAWVWMALLIGAIHFAWADEGAGFRLLALLVALFYGIKTLVSVEARLAGGPVLGVADWLAFALVWPGMRPSEFARKGQRRAGPGMVYGVISVFGGVAILFFARELFALTGSLPVAGFVFIAAFILTLHIGVFAVVTAAFRSLGYGARPPFRAPWRARTLHEFWAHRWNTGFSVMTSFAIYRPLVGRLGRGGATFAGFVASGLFHEVACSLPVNAGYGLPTSYFALHGLAMMIEQWLERRGRKLRGLAARVWVFAWVLLPAPLLFHSAFLRGVVLPLV